MNKKTVPYTVALRNQVMQETMKAADEIMYYKSTGNLYFCVCEGPILACTYEGCVSGTDEALTAYYKQFFEKSFPQAAVRIYN